MFDTSDKRAVTEKHTESVDAWYSDAQYDHHAVFVSPEKGLVGFPADGMYFLYTYDPEIGFAEKGRLESEEWYGSGRALLIGNYLYVVADGSVWVLDAESVTEIGVF